MVEHFPTAQLQANSFSVNAYFANMARDILFLDDLVACFTEAVSLEGGVGHRCFGMEQTQRRYLVGSDGGCVDLARVAGLDLVSFPITGWDEKPYYVEIYLYPGFLTPERRASLHTMSVLYVSRAIALLDVSEDNDDVELTADEKYCLEESQKNGRCYLDIGEDLGRTAQGVHVLLQRADRKIQSRN